MNYRSTRGQVPAVTAAKAILDGIAPDGGLYLPETVPQFSAEEKALLPTLCYAEAAKLVLGKYLDGFTPEEISGAVEAAYRSFPADAPVRLTPLDGRLTALELWHGPTAAFKDMALQLFPRLLPLCREKCGDTRETRILTATSGDTGKAALEGFRDVPGTKILVFYPHGGVSRIQELQMQTQTGQNVGVFAVKGNFDDAQTGVKRLFSDPDLREKLAQKNVVLSSANSINWGRLLPQIVYYVYTSFRLYEGEAVDFVVPTGNFGNILAGFLAKKMGAPVGKLVCASNKNRVLADFFETGVYDRNRPFYKTDSPSMDILISSNLERLLYLQTGDPDFVAEKMRALNGTGAYEIPAALRQALADVFTADAATDGEGREALRRLWETHRYLADPHTAVAAAVFEKVKDRLGKRVVLVSTANPYKFAPAVLGAFPVGPCDGFEAMDRLFELTGEEIPSPLSSLRTASLRFSAVISPGEMKQAALNA